MIIQKRKAVSSIIGAGFFIAVMGASFAAFIHLTNTSADLFETQTDISKTKMEKIKEKFEISAYANSSGYNLQVDITNTGKRPIEIVDLWIINRTAIDCPPCDAQLIPINYADSFVPIGKTISILENTPISLGSGIYDLKVVSSLGNTETFLFRVGDFSLLARLVSVPPLISSAENSTLILTVHNNSSKTLYDITPYDPAVVPLSSLDGGAFEQIPPLTIEQLDPNESAIFTWNYELRGAAGTNVVFTTNATAKRESSSTSWDVISNNAITTVNFLPSVKVSPVIQTPELFVVYPNPVGKNSQQASQGKDSRGFWGALLVNTLNQTITVHQIALSILQTTQGPDKIIDKDEDGRQHIQPCCILPYVDLINNDNYRDASAGGGLPKGPDGKMDGNGTWTVPEQNILLWDEDPDNPVTLLPNEVGQFVVKVRAVGGGTASGVDTFIIVANAHTSIGQFTNVGHTSTLDRQQTHSTIINAYPTSIDRTGSGEVEDPSNCYAVPESSGTCRYFDGALRYADDDFNGTRSIDSGEVGIYYITIREGHKHDDSYMPGTDEGLLTLFPTSAEEIYRVPTKLVISFPPGFPDIDYDLTQTGWGTPSLKTIDDGSKLLIVPLSVDIGNHRDTTLSGAAQQVDAERLSFEFCVTAPSLESTQIYAFTAFIDGRDSEDHVVGPVSEAIILKVIGTTDPEFGSIEDQASNCNF